jgi:cell division protein FtsW
MSLPQAQALSAVTTPRGHRARLPALDYWLLGAALALLCLGLVMVASASFPAADRHFAAPFHYVLRHLIAIGLGLTLAAVVFLMPMEKWERGGTLLFFVGLALLLLVFVPGLGRTVNGATRWIPVGPFSLQSSEFMKLFAVIYVSGYLVRRSDEVSTRISGFMKPLLLISISCAMIMAQPDFGTTAVLLATVLGLLFLGGVPVLHFAALMGVVSVLLVALVVLEPYRWERVTAFIDPWKDAFGAGYQLTQALIAFGRGEWFGVGLGNGIQKQFYLPEAHTDFLMAVIGEELGLLGTLLVMSLFAFVCWRAFRIGARAESLKQRFSSFVAYGLGLWLALQAFVNIGVNVGLLPTKGLTLPLMSYGGNSIIVACMVIAVLLRIDFENRRLATASGGDRSGAWDR